MDLLVKVSVPVVVAIVGFLVFPHVSHVYTLHPKSSLAKKIQCDYLMTVSEPRPSSIELSIKSGD